MGSKQRCREEGLQQIRQFGECEARLWSEGMAGVEAISKAGQGRDAGTWEQQAHAIPPLLASSPTIRDFEFKMRSNDCL